MKRIVFVAASLLTGVIVAQTGPIGFVGLIVPHGVRLVIGADNRLLLPVAAGAGATFLVLADTLARLVIQPAELPVGVVTAFCGAPFFVYLLRMPPPPAEPVSRESAVRSRAADAARPRRPCLPRGTSSSATAARSVWTSRRSRCARARSSGWSGRTARGRRRCCASSRRSTRPDRGEIRFRGRPLDAVSRLALAREVAVVPQEEQLAFSITVEELALMGRFPRGRGAALRGRRGSRACPRGDGAGGRPRSRRSSGRHARRRGAPAGAARPRARPGAARAPPRRADEPPRPPPSAAPGRAAPAAEPGAGHHGGLREPRPQSGRGAGGPAAPRLERAHRPARPAARRCWTRRCWKRRTAARCGSSGSRPPAAPSSSGSGFDFRGTSGLLGRIGEVLQGRPEPHEGR